MRIEHIIDSDTKTRLGVSNESKGNVVKKRRKRKKRKQERLSERDIKELMGVHRDRYHKVNGKVKRK